MDVKERVRRAVEINCVDYVCNPSDEYDVYTSENLSGHRSKKYYRVDAALLSPFIKEFTSNPDSGYITTINELLSIGYVPKKVSALNKVISFNNYDRYQDPIKLLYAEVLSSQILNFFGCPTTCNVAIKSRNEESYEVLSLDFLSYGEAFLTFDDLGCDFSGDLMANVKQIKEEFAMSYFDEYNKDDLDKVINDYVYSFLVRRHILKDSDFHDFNSGIIFNRETKEVKYINFDFEYGFSLQRTNLEDDLLYCAEYFPEVYERFATKVREFYDGIYQLQREFVLQRHDYVYRTMIEDTVDAVSAVVRKTKKLSKKR